MLENSFAAGKFLDPEAILKQCEIPAGCVAADFGCGSGYFSLPLAKAVGEGGKVISFDVLPQALESVSSKAKNMGLSNVVTKRANLEKEGGSKLDNEEMDFVVMKDVLFQNKNKEIVLGEAYRVLRAGGIALVVEWNDQCLGIGPEAELRLPEHEVKKNAEEKGFKLDKEIDAGKFHYAFLLKK